MEATSSRIRSFQLETYKTKKKQETKVNETSFTVYNKHPVIYRKLTFEDYREGRFHKENSNTQKMVESKFAAACSKQGTIQTQLWCPLALQFNCILYTSVCPTHPCL